MLVTENHVFCVWPWAKRQHKIHKYILDNFFIVDLFKWEVTGASLAKFYGGPFPIKDIQPGQAQIYVVRTYAERAIRETNSGPSLVNPVMFDTKQKLRKWGGTDGRLTSVHGSDTPDEAIRNLMATLREYDEALDPTTFGGVMLRPGGPSDIDILVRQWEDFTPDCRQLDAYNNIPVDAKDVKYKWLVNVRGQPHVYDVRVVGDGYVDPAFQEAVLLGESFDKAHEYHEIVHKGRQPMTREFHEWMMGAGYKYTRPSDPYFHTFGVVIGNVVDGIGAASTTPQPGLQEAWHRAMGHDPYPGTLNIKYSGPFGLPKPFYTSTMYYRTPEGAINPTPLHFWHGSIEDVDVILSMGGNRENEVEVLADVHLRSELGLKTGDEVAVVVYAEG